MSLTIGVDLGQQRDKTAIVAVSSRVEAPERDEAEERHRPKRRRHFDVVRAQTLRPSTPYPAQVEQIVGIAESVADGELPTLWLDATAVGRPICDMLRDACPYAVHAVTATGATGDVVRHGRLDLSVPKSVLVGSLEVALSTRRLHCPADLPGAAELRKELAAFSYELSATGRPLYEGKSAHDDLVSALALAMFGAERGGGLSAFREYMAGRATEHEGTEEYVPS